VYINRHAHGVHFVSRVYGVMSGMSGTNPAMAEPQAVKAVALLQRAIQAGYKNLSVLNKDTDRNLLFGILAVQMDFITKDALIEAMHVHKATASSRRGVGGKIEIALHFT
jgi:hypothetical protein